MTSGPHHAYRPRANGKDLVEAVGDDRHAKELAEAKRKVDELEHENDKLRRTLRTASRLLEPYNSNDKR